VLEMKKTTILLTIPLVLIASCYGAEDKVAIKCKTNFTITAEPLPPETGTSEENFLIDYKAGKVFSYDDNNMVEMKDVSISPSKISFLHPPKDFGSTAIDRNSLTIATDETKSFYGNSIHTIAKGVCTKTSLPNLSSSGKKI